ncbi:hypothetical protein Tco_0496062 [Tanacetum coccineum]
MEQVVSTEGANQKLLRSYLLLRFLCFHNLRNKLSCPQSGSWDLGTRLMKYDLEEYGLKMALSGNASHENEEVLQRGETGHFARECRTKEDNRRRDGWNPGNKDGSRTGKKEESKALVTVDGESVDWTTHSEDDENYAFMASNSSGSDTQVPSCSNECKESYANLKRLYDAQREQLSDASVEIKVIIRYSGILSYENEVLQSVFKILSPVLFSTDDLSLLSNMAALESCPKHNMIAYLEKTEGNVEFHEVIDFLRRSYIYHALTVSPIVSTTFVEQFWTSAKSKTINNVRHITAKVAGKFVSISEASIRTDLIFDDADGIDSLPNQAIFDVIQLMGYEGDLTVFTFNKALFSPQWSKSITRKSFSQRNIGLHNELINYHMETKNDQSDGRTEKCGLDNGVFLKFRLSTEDVVSTDKEGVSTDFEKVSTDRPIVSTDGSKVNTVKPIVNGVRPANAHDREQGLHADFMTLMVLACLPLEVVKAILWQKRSNEEAEALGRILKQEHETCVSFTHSSYDDEGAEADFTNLETVVNVSPIPTSRINPSHPSALILGDPTSAVQTRSKVNKSSEAHAFIALEDEAGLMLCKRIIDDEVYVSQPPGFLDPKFLRKVYKVVKALYGLLKLPTDGFKFYVDDIIFGLANESWFCDELDALMKSSFQMCSIGRKLTFFLSLHSQTENKWYIISQDNLCLVLGFQVTPKASTFKLLSKNFLDTDSDYAGANLDRKSTTGGCQFLGRRLITWQCKKQTIVATSTTEAEYVAAASCCGQVLWIQNQMLDYGFNFMNTKIYIDNESTICIVKNPVYHSKTKHIAIRHHFIRDAYEKKLIQVLKIHTDDNVADLLTKAFDVSRFQFLVVSIGMINP